MHKPEETLTEHMRQQKAAKPNKPQHMPPPEPLRVRSDANAVTGIYVMGGAGPRATTNTTETGDHYNSNPPTMDRKHNTRLSWATMRRRGEESMTVLGATPSPQTSRSNASTAGTTMGNGTASGRTTAASGRISTSGVATISGSNNTLNDINSDFNSHEAVGSEFQYTTSAGVSPLKNLSSNGSFNLANGSTVKLLPVPDDEKNQQTKCSVFRGLMLCICLNVTYANVVRFPRELNKDGTAYLIPYLILLFLVGLPIILLEISVGQFLGQGAAHTWRASPIFKGACIVSRFASWVSTIWVSLQAVLAAAYIGMILFSGIPFEKCAHNVTRAVDRYILRKQTGQECLKHTFLTPFWEDPQNFGLLCIGLIGVWAVVMVCTHNGKVLRRSLFFLGLVGFALMCCLTGWEVRNSFARDYFPALWTFELTKLSQSNIWFNALVQVLFSTNCGFGALPTLTGKFLYKGDAVRTSVVYLCFNLLVNTIAVTLFMVQHVDSKTIPFPELTPFANVYDRVLGDDTLTGELLPKLIPCLIYLLMLIAALVSVTVALYTCTRLVPRHPNYVISLVALIVSIITLAAPEYIVARVLDTRITGTLVITALVFELIAMTWIYGAKNIYTDLEFSIGRPIFKFWMGLWCICPAILTGLLVWWCSDDDSDDRLAEYVPRWAPIIFALALIFIVACVQIFRQVEYNFFGMICEASKPAKEWGPADPLARHAWKQWRSVCQDTGRRDFTLRRRGTRDYTHSIKKGQYSTANKYAGNGQLAHTTWKSGNSSPNYSGSMFGDSAIEEDISVDKFPGVSQQFVPFQANDGKALRYSHRSRTQQRIAAQQQQQQHHHQQQLQPATHTDNHEKHREVVYIRRLSDDGQHATRIEITPSNESISYGGVGVGARNPLGRANHTSAGLHQKRFAAAAPASDSNHNRNSVVSVGGAKLPPATRNGSEEHICWRKFSVKANGEFSTEL